ncbi:hypothetical protein PCASD_18999 [Puccinia coronata f. sp. avenae]|uniref:Uncharacterized protein n=1 Tax=Puccinia coronata f. sp. avenae TaxID=200324 RepID=A0A2N5SRR8_9BASI|nr:hypothetical protein PCASD_18999 [Puccinia coronata f. sp. avenae]
MPLVVPGFQQRPDNLAVDPTSPRFQGRPKNPTVLGASLISSIAPLVYFMTGPTSNIGNAKSTVRSCTYSTRKQNSPITKPTSSPEENVRRRRLHAYFKAPLTNHSSVSLKEPPENAQRKSMSS